MHYKAIIQFSNPAFMSARNLRDPSFSQDDAFLQNFDSIQESRDILDHLCEEQPGLEGEEKREVREQRQQREDEMQEEVSGSRGKGEGRKGREGRSRERKKVFYRDKMAELMKPGEYVKQQYNYVAYSQFQTNKIPISKDEQLKRNRESAKNSRQRKKEYITILEKKNEENQRQIDELRVRLQQVTFERDRLKEDNHQEIKNFLRSKATAYEQLEKLLANPLNSTEQIKGQVESMLERFSASGSERVAVMNYYMNEIIEDLISDIHKYFLNCSAFNQGLTPSTPPKPVDLQVMAILDLDLPKMGHLINKYKDRFSKEASVFKALTQDFYRVFKSIESQSKVIELVFADLIKEFDCRKIAELIMWFQENRFSRDLKKARKEWTDQLTSGEETIEVIRKQTKQN